MSAFALWASLGVFTGTLETSRATPDDPPFAGGEASLGQIEREMANLQPRSLRPVGSTSVVLRARGQEGVSGALRPASRTHATGHLHEIAAYRLARALGMDNVPPSVLRRLDQDLMRAKLDPSAEDRWPSLRRELRWSRGGEVAGSMTYWIPEMRELALDREPALSRWTAHLRADQRRGPDADFPPSLLRDLSTCVLFDFVIGNADRFSGANLRGLPDRSRVFVRDHNLAFFPRLVGRRRARLTASLLRTQRFSRGVVSKLAALSPDELRAIFLLPPDVTGGDEQGVRTLTETQINALLARRATALSYIRALIDEHGEAAVLSFR